MNKSQRDALSDEARVKRCPRCAETKPASDFYVSNGRLEVYCKPCKRAYTNALRSTPEAKNAASEAQRRLRATPAGKEKKQNYARSWIARNRWYSWCHSAINYAILSGRISRPGDAACEVGEGCSGRHEWHHDSYRRADWLNVRCLCAKHHNEWHRNNKPVPFDGGAE